MKSFLINHIATIRYDLVLGKDATNPFPNYDASYYISLVPENLAPRYRSDSKSSGTNI